MRYKCMIDDYQIDGSMGSVVVELVTSNQLCTIYDDADDDDYGASDGDVGAYDDGAYDVDDDADKALPY